MDKVQKHNSFNINSTEHDDAPNVTPKYYNSSPIGTRGGKNTSAVIFTFPTGK
jgi:hypothetical protein